MKSTQRKPAFRLDVGSWRPALLLAFLLAAGCGDGTPRTLPFPELEPRAPFPELAGSPAQAAPGAPGRTSFADRLAPAGSPPATEPAQGTAARAVTLGRQLAGEIPPDPAWSWQEVEDGVTLIACRPDGGRPAALVYAEAFPSRMGIAPSEEIQRFQITVNPEGTHRRLTPSAVAGTFADGLVRQVAQGTGTGAPEAARLLQLLATRTGGAGLGFRPAPGSFTGWKWVGRNDHRVTVRLARFTGTWETGTRLPAEIGQRLEALGKIPALGVTVERLAPAADTAAATAAGGVSAYLLVGSATDDAEQSGAHLALLWQHSSDHRCVEGLASFLASLQMSGASDPPGAGGFGDGQVSDITDAAGLQLLPSEALVSLDRLQASTPPPTAPPAGPAR